MRKCLDCERLIEDYGKTALDICDGCGHYYYKKEDEPCSCGKELVKKEELKKGDKNGDGKD